MNAGEWGEIGWPDGWVLATMKPKGGSVSPTKKPTISRKLAGLLGLTLMTTFTACATALYGVSVTRDDLDGDGSFTPLDCDDTDPTIYPGATDTVGDGVDQNCDGVDGVAGDTGSS